METIMLDLELNAPGQQTMPLLSITSPPHPVTGHSVLRSSGSVTKREFPK